MATVKTATPQGPLLSRISTSLPGSSGPIGSSASFTRKRSSSDNEERPAKRRVVSQDTNSHQSEHKAPAWISIGESCDADATREIRLHHEIKQLVSYITPSPEEREARGSLVQRIESLLKVRWSDIVVTLFGSSSTGLELSGGDIDLVVSFSSSPKMSDPEKKRRLASIGDLIRRSGMTSWVNRIFSARVPIVSFVTTSELGEISFDISIRNDEDTGPRAIPIMFLSLRDLNDASQSSLSSYAITILCISFLQRNPTRRPKEFLESPDENSALGILLMDFFRHYGHDFSYATHYISVTDKGVFTKKSKNWGLKGNSISFLAVQCLLIPENNITRGCGKISSIVEAFKEAYYALQNTPLCDKNGERTPSLLESIYELPEDMDTQRRRLEETVHSGAFSRAVEACGSSSNSHSRAVSGGVTIGSAHGNHGPKRMNGTLNPHKPALRLGPGPLSGEANTNQAFARPGSNSSSRIEQLPTLHWTFYRDRQRARNVSRQRQQQQHQQQQQQHQLNAVRQQQFNGTQFDFQYQVPDLAPFTIHFGDPPFSSL
ncbi:Nucleotidyltransferase [Pyrrhoderma noxium]|uniref:polynucleotide adenylyltransferase n=1 Tax=Pyrrhoderma noxium TaxID=2282107 RepID=A0A286USN6_9AGAM|nr:Nucleotidyltransferase [Pyrrhoderma noxium]